MKQQGFKRLWISICGVVMLTSMQAGACAEPSRSFIFGSPRSKSMQRASTNIRQP